MASRSAVQRLIASVSPETRELNSRYCSLICSGDAMRSQELRRQIDTAYRTRNIAELRELFDRYVG